MTLQKLKKQITQKTKATIRIGAKPLHDFTPQAYTKNYNNTIALIGVTPKQYSMIHNIIEENGYIITEKYHETDINKNQVSYLTIKIK